MIRMEGTIPDEISRERKKEVKNQTVVNPATIVFAMDAESWTRDGRENLPVAPQLVCSFLRAFTTANASDAAPDAHYKAADGKEIKGNPVVFGLLSAANVAVMGTDDKPLLVANTSGRQTIKTCEYLTALLKWCRELVKLHGDDAQRQAMIGGDAFDKEWAAAQEPDYAAACAAANGGKGLQIVRHFGPTEWLIIFKASTSKLGKPLVGKTYSAVFFVSVKHDDANKPGLRASLERAKLANLRLPSTFSGEADCTKRLVQDRVKRNGMSEAEALEDVRKVMVNPVAVGAQSFVSIEYTEQMYRLSMLSQDIQAMVDAETNPVKALQLLARVTRKCFKAGTVNVEPENKGDDMPDALALTINVMTAAEQRKALERKQRHNPTGSRQTKKTAVSSSVEPVAKEVIERYRSMARSPLSGLSEKQRIGAAAVAAFLAHQAGDDSDIAEHAYLVGVETLTTDETPLKEALEAVDAWNGKSGISWRSTRNAADGVLLAAAQKLVSDTLASMPMMKPAERPAWLAEKLRGAA